MIEQYAAASKEAVAFTVVDRHPVSVKLRHAIRASRPERGGFRLRDGLDLSEHLGRAGLVEADGGVNEPDRPEQVQRPDDGDLGRDRKSVVVGKCVSVSGDIGRGPTLKKQQIK